MSISTKQFLFIVLAIEFVFFILAYFMGPTPEYYFKKEGAFITWLSSAQLFLCSIFAWKIFLHRKASIDVKSKNWQYLLWVIIAIGFLYLGIDEIGQIHEKSGRIVRGLFNLEKNNLTARIDDLVVGLYAVFSIGILYLFRDEIKELKGVSKYFVVAFVIIFLMVGVDTLTTRKEVLKYFFHIKETRHMVLSYMIILEEVLKVLAGGVLLSTFNTCLTRVKNKS